MFLLQFLNFMSSYFL